jgi:hypothetical protein
MVPADECICNNGYNNKERCFLRGLCRGVISRTCLELCHLWHICQLVRTLAEDIVKICYQETNSKDIEDFISAVQFSWVKSRKVKSLLVS